MRSAKASKVSVGLDHQSSPSNHQSSFDLPKMEPFISRTCIGHINTRFLSTRIGIRSETVCTVHGRLLDIGCLVDILKVIGGDGADCEEQVAGIHINKPMLRFNVCRAAMLVRSEA